MTMKFIEYKKRKPEEKKKELIYVVTSIYC